MTAQAWLESDDPQTILATLAVAAGAGWLASDGPPPLPASTGETGGRLPFCTCCRTACDRWGGHCPASRKLRLFACGCCRRVLPEPVCRAAVEAAERHADGGIRDRDAAQALQAF